MQAKTASGENRKGLNIGLAAAGVFGIALCVYLTSFSGLPISDDEELYASAARNLAVLGTLSAGQLSGNARLLGNYHGVEPAFPALASFWYRLFLDSELGHLQTLYLLPVVITALSAALIVIIAAQLRFPGSVGATGALLYAFGSMAWPYAKTLFREPLIGLLFLGSISAFLWLIREKRLWISVLAGAILATLLALLVLTRVVMAAAGLAFLVALPFVHPSLQAHRGRAATFSIGGAALLLAIGIALGTLRATDADVFYRFTGGFVSDAITRLNTISHSHFAEALLAPLVSPWKGLLFYSPICLIGLISLLTSARRQPIVALLTCSVLIALLLGQALAYDDQWWTPTWGSRFLVPVIPLLVLASLPLLEQLTKSGRSGWVLIGALLAIGFLIQLPAILYNSAEFTAASYEEAAGAFPGALVWDLARTPIIAQWQAATSQEPDLLLWRIASAQPATVWLICALAAAGVLLGAVAVRRVLAGADQSSIVLMGCCLLMSGLTAAGLVKSLAYDPAYETAAFKPLCTYLQDHMQPTDVLIVQPYPGSAWQYLMNAECGQRVWYSLPYDEQQGDTLSSVSQKIPAGTRYWLIRQFWSEGVEMQQSSPVSSGDTLLQQQVFSSPYHLSVGAYLRGTSK